MTTSRPWATACLTNALSGSSRSIRPTSPRPAIGTAARNRSRCLRRVHTEPDEFRRAAESAQVEGTCRARRHHRDDCLRGVSGLLGQRRNLPARKENGALPGLDHAGRALVGGQGRADVPAPDAHPGAARRDLRVVRRLRARRAPRMVFAGDPRRHDPVARGPSAGKRGSVSAGGRGMPWIRAGE